METAMNRLRALPSIQRLLEQAGPLIAATSHSAVTRVLRDVLDEIRASQAPAMPDASAILADVGATPLLARLDALTLARVER